MVGLLFALSSSAMGAECLPPPDGLVAWWRGEHSAYDEVGTNHGVLMNGPTFAPGLVGHAFNFNASSNSVAVAASAPELNPTNAITIEAWVKPFSLPNTGPTIVRKNLDATGGTQYSLMLGNGLTNGLLHMNVAASLGGTSVSGGFVPTNVWTHVAGTYDRQFIRIYVNGAEVGNASSTVAIPASLRALLIGNEDLFAGDRAFDGLIDELAIYNRALSASEIAAIYAAGSAGKCGRRIEWFKIAGGGGQSTNTMHRLRGTIGQHDAGGPMTNGQYSVTGGFWVLPTVIQTGGAPTLTIVPATPGNATISWTPNTPGWILQETWVLSPANWTNSPSGSANPIVVPATTPTRFYRLFKP